METSGSASERRGQSSSSPGSLEHTTLTFVGQIISDFDHINRRQVTPLLPLGAPGHLEVSVPCLLISGRERAEAHD